MMGCDGALIGFAGTATDQVIAMHRAVASGDYATAKAIWDRLGRWRGSAGAHRSAIIARA